MAIVFDLVQFLCELAMILVPILHAERNINRQWTAVIIVCTIASMTLNVDAFLQQANDLKAQILAIVWGILLPLGVLTLSYIGSAFVLNEQDTESRVQRRRRGLQFCREIHSVVQPPAWLKAFLRSPYKISQKTSHGAIL